MATPMRFHYGRIRGRSVQHVRFHGVHPWSAVYVNASETTGFGSADFHPGYWNSQRYHLFIGAADVFVTNVAPYEGGVAFMLHVDYWAPLSVAVTIQLLDENPIQVRVTY